MNRRTHPIWRILGVAGLAALIAALGGCPSLTIDLSGVDLGNLPTGEIPEVGDGPAEGGAAIIASAMETAAFDAVNAARMAQGLPALTMRSDLLAVARGHSADMIERDFFSHVNPDGEDPFDRMRDMDISYNIAGENIAWNNFPNPVDVAVEGWMESQGHRENILRDSFTHTGMGVATDGEGAYFFTQVFIGVSKSISHQEVQVFYFAE